MREEGKEGRGKEEGKKKSKIEIKKNIKRNQKNDFRKNRIRIKVSCIPYTNKRFQFLSRFFQAFKQSQTNQRCAFLITPTRTIT